MLSIEKEKKFLINFAYIAAIIAIVYFVFKFMLGYLMPFVVAIVVAVLAQKPARYFNRKLKISRSIGAIVISILLYIVILAVVGSIFYFLYDQLYGFFTDLPKYVPSIKNAMNDIKEYLAIFTKNLPQGFSKYLDNLPGDLIGSVAKSATKSLSTIASTAVLSTPEIVVSVIVTFVATCYLAWDYDTISAYIIRHSPKKVGDIIKEAKEMASQTLIKLLKGYIFLMAITFVELNIALALLGVKYFVVIAAIIAIIDILPVLGTGTVLIPWGVICIIQGEVTRGIIILAVYVAITVIRNFLEPKIIGDQVGLYPLITLFAMFCGLKLFGVIGMLLTPIAVILVINFYRSRYGSKEEITEQPKKPNE